MSIFTYIYIFLFIERTNKTAKSYENTEHFFNLSSILANSDTIHIFIYTQK